MNAVKTAAAVVIAAVILGLVHGGFSYTKDAHEAKLGPIELSVKDKETVNIRVWAGVGAIVIGGALLWLVERRANRGCFGVPPAEPHGEVDPYTGITAPEVLAGARRPTCRTTIRRRS